MARHRFDKLAKLKIFIDADGKCRRCGRTLDLSWHADHRISLKKGGSTDLRNAQATCPNCNLRKGARE
jgi:5-methylcytosine-specific restriction endonuclease McrA